MNNWNLLQIRSDMRKALEGSMNDIEYIILYTNYCIELYNKAVKFSRIRRLTPGELSVLDSLGIDKP